MRISYRTLGIATALIALVGVAGWIACPDLRDRVRLVSPGLGAWIKPGDPIGAAGETGAAGAATPSAPPCTQADLEAWQMPTPPDAASRHVTLYSDRAGAKRVGQGDTLAPGLQVASITPTQVTLVCADGAASPLNRPGHLSRQLTATQPVAPTASPTRLTAPLGN